MASRVASVIISIDEIFDIPPDFVDQSDSVFLAAHIGGRFMGRSRRIPKGARQLDLLPNRFCRDVAATGDPIAIKVGIYRERTYGEPEEVVAYEKTIPAPYVLDELILGDAPAVRATVTTKCVNANERPTLVSQSARSDESYATLRAQFTAVVEFESIKGLYAPKSVGAPGIERTEVREGYLSEDDLGRVFIDRDMEGNWVADGQELELSVTLDLSTALLPDGARVSWSLVDVDDLSDDRLDCHLEAGVYWDPSDRGDDGALLGARGGDNEGGVEGNPWGEAGDAEIIRSDTASAETKIVDNRSAVRLRCPQVAGDNFVVRAQFVSDTPFKSFAAETGIMTMWHRIDVQYIPMNSATRLPLERVAPYFEPGFVQIDFQTDDFTYDDDFLTEDPSLLESAALDFFGDVYSKAGEKGWFVVVAALDAYPQANASADMEKLYDGHATPMLEEEGDNRLVLRVPAECSGAGLVVFKTEENRTGFFVKGAGEEDIDGIAHTWLELVPDNLYPYFKAGDGSLGSAYSDPIPTMVAIPGAALRGGRFGRPARVEIFALNRRWVRAISPTVTRGGTSCFGGRMVIFTRHPRLYDAQKNAPHSEFQDRALALLIQGICQNFGLPHKCGRENWRAKERSTCIMNYRYHWVAETFDDPAAEENATDFHFCARHLKEMRRTRLSRHKGLAWS